MTFQFIYH